MALSTSRLLLRNFTAVIMGHWSLGVPARRVGVAFSNFYTSYPILRRKILAYPEFSEKICYALAICIYISVETKHISYVLFGHCSLKNIYQIQYNSLFTTYFKEEFNQITMLLLPNSYMLTVLNIL